MSNRMAPSQLGSTRARSRRSEGPPRCGGRPLQHEAGAVFPTTEQNSSPFAAARQASVAMTRMRFTPRAWILPAQTSSAPTHRTAHGRRAQPSAGAEAFAEADDAREGIDHAKLRAVAGPRANGSCWCQGPARHRGCRCRDSRTACPWARVPRKGRRFRRRRSQPRPAPRMDGPRSGQPLSAAHRQRTARGLRTLCPVRAGALVPTSQSPRRELQTCRMLTRLRYQFKGSVTPEKGRAIRQSRRTEPRR